MQDLRDLCDCMTTDQINDYGIWFRLGMVLKRSGAPVSLWDEVSRRSSKYKHGECAKKWVDCNRRGEGERELSIGSVHYWAEMGDTERYNKINPTLKIHTHVFSDDAQYPAIEINTPFLTPDTDDTPKTPDQETFQRLTDETMDDPSKKALIVRSRYGSGKTTYLQRLIKARNPERVLFINYRQTLARDIMKSFGKLGFGLI